MAKNEADQNQQDLDLLADFLLGTIRTGAIDIGKAMGAGKPLKRQAGNIDKLLGQVLQRHCREDEKTATMVELAAQQSEAFARLADKWGLRVKEAQRADDGVKDAKPC